MLFSKYNLTKNHGEFVHLNMLKWALRHVPELGDKTVNDDEIVKSMDVGRGGVDVTTVKDNVTNNRHVPYTDVQVDGISKPVVNVATNTIPRGTGQTPVARLIGLENNETVLANTGTDIIDKDALDTESKVSPIDAVGFDHEGKFTVDGNNSNYITRLYEYSYKNGHIVNGNSYNFRPYTAVTTDDSDNLESKMEISHTNNTFTGVNFPKTGKSYSVRPTTAITTDGGATTEDKMVVNHDTNNNLTGVTFPSTGKSYNIKSGGGTPIFTNDNKGVNEMYISLDKDNPEGDKYNINEMQLRDEKGWRWPINVKKGNNATLKGIHEITGSEAGFEYDGADIEYVFGEGDITSGQKLTTINFYPDGYNTKMFSLDVSGLNIKLTMGTRPSNS